MVKFIIVRHGYSTSNLDNTLTGQQDVPLTEIGIKQGQLASQYIFDNYKIDAIYSSDLIRAVKTVEKLSNLTNLPIIKDKRLREIGCGVWEGLPVSLLMDKYEDKYSKWRAYLDEGCPQEGETFTQVKERAFEVLKEIATNNDGKTIVVATHGGLIKVFQGACLGVASKEVGKIPYVTNASIFELDYKDEKFNIASQMIDSYLQGMITQMPKGI